MGSLAVDGFSLEHVPLTLFVVQRHAVFEVQVMHLAELQAKLLLFVLADPKRLGGLDGLPLGRQRDRTGHWLLDGARLSEQRPDNDKSSGAPHGALVSPAAPRTQACILTRALENELGAQRAVVNEHTHELMNKFVMGDLARELQEQVERLYRTIREINGLLADLRFGNSRYQFKVTPHRHAQELVDLVRKQSILDQSSRALLS